nr:MAG TPA: PORTAL PROTEIN, 15 PROTEIN, HEAD PROTEIN, VIRAL INFECTION, TAILED.2A [Caudoviricetes sp.]
MYDPFNKVFTIVKKSISTKCPNAGTSTDGSPPAFPYAGFRQLDNATTADDLENNENAVNSTIEITAYSNKNLTEAKAIAALAVDAMREMGYRRTGPFTPVNAADTNIYRVIYRYNRTIGTGEEF